MEAYITNGAEVAWLIDPERRVVEIYRPGESPEVRHEPSSVLGTGPTAEFELPIGEGLGVAALKIEEYTTTMDYALAEPQQTVRIRPDHPMSDEELMRFCEDNDIARIERDTNGELLLMSAAGNRTGRANAYVNEPYGA